MDKWEYMVLEQPAGAKGFIDRQTREEYPGTFPSLLNALGAEGWQLMSTHFTQEGSAVAVMGRKAGTKFA